MNATVHDLLAARAARVQPADRLALAYLYNAPGGSITIGPGHDHEPQIVLALVKRLHPMGLLRGNVRARSLHINEQGRRIVEHWIGTICAALSDPGRERVVDSLSWLGCPSVPIDVELEGLGLVRTRNGGRSGELHFVPYTWRTELCLAVARSLERKAS